MESVGDHIPHLTGLNVAFQGNSYTEKEGQ